MRKRTLNTLLISFCILFPLTVSAQSGQQLRVTIVDEITSQPVGGATVQLLEEGALIGEMMTDASGIVTFSVTVVSTESLPDTDFTLSAPYPNPSTGRVTLPLAMAEGGNVTVTIVDLLGRTVAQGDGLLPAGTHRVGLNLDGLPAGTYFTRVSSGVRSATSSAVVRTGFTPGTPSVTLDRGNEFKRP